MIIGRTFHLYFETRGWILGSTNWCDWTVIYSPCPKDDTAFSFHFFTYVIYGNISVSLSKAKVSSAVTDASQTKLHHCTVSYGILHTIYTKCMYCSQELCQGRQCKNCNSLLYCTSTVLRLPYLQIPACAALGFELRMYLYVVCGILGCLCYCVHEQGNCCRTPWRMQAFCMRKSVPLGISEKNVLYVTRDCVLLRRGSSFFLYLQYVNDLTASVVVLN